MKKRFLIIISVTILVLVFAFIIIKHNIDKNTKLYETKVVHDITFSKLKIKKSKGKYKIKVKLSSKKDVNAEYFNAEFKNKNNESLAVVSGYIGNIKKDEIKYIEMETSKNLKGAYEVIYTVYAE